MSRVFQKRRQIFVIEKNLIGLIEEKIFTIKLLYRWCFLRETFVYDFEQRWQFIKKKQVRKQELD